jgi:hypothetical protein
VLQLYSLKPWKGGTQSWPLPNPPIIDSDFPPIHPISPQDIIEQGLGLLHSDKGMFDSKLNSVVDLIVPHRMNLTDDPFEVHQKWLEKRVDTVSGKNGILNRYRMACAISRPNSA